ncbi:MAG: hypothetical protein AAGJ83_10225 [Planctomycetota bacterium]
MQRTQTFMAVFTIGLTGLFAAHFCAAQGRESLRDTIYSLRATFNDPQDQAGFFHDVKVRVRSEQLTLRVIKDLVPTDQPRDKASAGSGTTDGLSGGTNPAWRRRPAGIERWLPTGRTIHGSISNHVVSFGFTAIRDGELSSFHFTGKTTLGGAAGKVTYLPSRGPVLEGQWELHHPNPRAFPISPSMKGVPAGDG